MTIDYTKYTLEELIDVEANIDSNLYPERHKEVLALINAFESKGIVIEEPKYNFFERVSETLQPFEPWLSISSFISFLAVFVALQTHAEFITPGHVIIMMWLWGAGMISRIFSKKHFSSRTPKGTGAIFMSLWFLFLFIATVNLLL
jgi:hypothetical protein